MGILDSLGSVLGSTTGLGALGSIVGSFFGSNAQSNAAQQASQAQIQAAQQAMANQQQDYSAAVGQQQGLLNQGLGMGQATLNNIGGAYSPLQAAGTQGIAGLNNFSQGGQNAFQAQQALTGALGPEAQQQAMSGIQNSAMFQGLLQQGNQNILQNASATGSLRGGNTMAALGQFAPALLNQQIQQQIGNLGTQAGLGANAAGTLGGYGVNAAQGIGQGNLGVLQANGGLLSQSGSNLTSLANNNSAAMNGLIGNIGSANAGNALAQGAAGASFWNTAGGALNQANLLTSLQQRAGIASTQPGGGFFGAAPSTGGSGTGWGSLAGAEASGTPAGQLLGTWNF